MKKLGIVQWTMAAMSLLMLAACADLYFDDMTMVELYTRNFIRQFGLVDPEQDWNMAKATEVSLDLGDTRRSSVKIYGKYKDKYYLCADLTNIRGHINVPVDVPKSTEDMLVVVDGRNYLGNLSSMIDCTGTPAAVSRAESDSPLVGNANIRVTGHPTDYDMKTWKHSSSGETYTINATGYTTTTVKIGDTKGDLLRKNRPQAVYSYDNSYQVINAQQVAPLVSKESWEPNYWSFGSGYTNYLGDHSIGFVPEGGVGDTKVDGNPGRNNILGNTENTGVTQNFTFELDRDMFTVYPMYYGTNLVHILGFYLIDDNDMPILDQDGHVMKFPIYKTKQGDDILVKDMSKEISSIGILQANTEGKVYVTEGATKALKLALYNDKNEAISRTVIYNDVTITNSNASYFTITKDADGLTLTGVRECTDLPVTIAYRGFTYTLYVSVDDRNTIYDVRVNNAVETSSGKQMTLNVGDKREVTFDFVNGAGAVVTGLTDVQKAAVIDQLEWSNWAEDLYEITRENHKIYVRAKAASYKYWDNNGQEHTGSDQWSNFWIPGKSVASDNNSVHIIVVDPFADIVLGLVNTDNTLVTASTTVTAYVNGDTELTVVDVKDANEPTVATLSDAAWAKVKIDNAPWGTTITKSESGHKIIIHGTQEASGAVAKVSLDGYNDKYVEFKVDITKDPNAYKDFKIVDGTSQEVSSVTLPLPTAIDLTLKATNQANGDYTLTMADEVEVTYNGNSSTYFSVTRKNANTITVTPVSAGEGTAYIKVNGVQQSLGVTVTDPNRLVSMKIVDGNDNEVSTVSLTVPATQTLRLKGTNAGGGDYTFTASDNVVPDYERGADSKFTISNNAGELTLTPLSEGKGKVKLKIDEITTQEIEVTVTDPTKLSTMKIVDGNGDDVTSVTLYIGTPETLYLSGTDAGGNAYTFKSSDVAIVSYSWNADGKFTISQSADVLTLTPIAEVDNSDASVSIGSVSSQNITINVVDPNKLTALKMVNTDGTALPSELSIEPGEYYDIKVKGINGRGAEVDLTPDQYSSLQTKFGLGHNQWDVSDTYANATAAKTNSNNGVRITATGVNASGKGFFVEIGDAYSNVITLKTDYIPEHKLSGISVGNTVAYDWMSNALVLKKGTSLAIAINCTNGNGGTLDTSYALQQLSVSPTTTDYCDIALVGNYYVITAKSVGSASVTIGGGNSSSQSYYVVVVDADYTGNVSTDPRPGQSGVRKQIAPHPAKVVRAANNAKAGAQTVNNIKTVKSGKKAAAKSAAKSKSTVKTTKPAKAAVAKPVATKPVVTYKPSRKVQFLTAKELKAWEKKHAKKQTMAPKPRYANTRSRATSRAGETAPPALQYDATTQWRDINKTWNNVEDVAAFPTKDELLARVKGFDVTITGGLPHKKVGLYIDVLDNPDYGTGQKQDLYYTGLYPTDFSKGYAEYGTFNAANNPFNYTHYSQQLLNIYTARDYDHDRNSDIVAGTTKFAYSYGCAYRHPVSDRTFFSFEDWPIKHPSPRDKSLTGNIYGYDYNERDFWGLNDKDDDKETPKQKYTGDYSSDRDLNDLVFVMYGAKGVDGDKPFPTIETTAEFEWLWALEDLGATDDFDFNDMVMKISTLTRNITMPEGGEEGRADDGLKFYKEVTFKPMCAGGTLPLYVHFDEYTLRPGRWAGDETYEFFTANKDNAAQLDIPTDCSHLNDLKTERITDFSEFEIHNWFGVSNHNVMINTTAGSYRPSQECTIYLCEDHFNDYNFTIANFGGKKSIAVGEHNDARLFVSVRDGRASQYDNSENITPDWAKDENNSWVLTAPDKGKVTQMFMILDVNWRWPAERKHILDAYPDFNKWVNNGDNDDWYERPSSVSGLLY